MLRKIGTGSLAAALLLAGCAQGMEDDVQEGGPDAAGRADAREYPDAGPHPDAEERPDAAPLPDAEPVPTACEKLDTPAHTVTTYPGTFDGDLAAATAYLAVTDGSCTVEEAPYGVNAPGPEQVIRLDNLIAGTTYAVRVAAAFDSAFYVVTGCSGGSGFSAGECLYYTDAELSAAELGLFVAPSGGTAWVIVDYYSASTPADGSYTLTVVADPECTDDWACNATSPVCDTATMTCAAGYDQCAGDDANDSADDGPAGATVLNLVPDQPAVVAASICGAPEAEADWFRFTAAAGDDVNLTLTWDAVDELDFYVYDGNGAQVDYGYATTSPYLHQLADLAAGEYFIKLFRYGNASTTVTAYTLTAALPECTWSGDCGTTEPICTADQLCAAAAAACTGDGTGDDGDDGASVARVVTMPPSGPATFNGKICSAPVGNSIFVGDGYALEEDWYRIDLAAGDTVSVSLSWTETAGEDLDLYLFDSTGTQLDYGWFDNPEVVTATATAAGTYYVAVHLYGPAGVAAATPYMLSVTKTP